MTADALSLPAAELTEHYRAKRLSPVEVTRAALERIAELNPVYNAFCLIDEEAALVSARESEARWQRAAPAGMVDGVPTTVKDLILTKGWPTLRGSRTISPKQAWDEDGAPVARLREQGAVFLGKTTTPEFGWKGVTDSPLTGVTRNPWDARLTPGGSSGGAAVAAALGMGTLASGHRRRRLDPHAGRLLRTVWDQADLGVVPAHPHSLAWTLWHQGPITRTVADAALMLTVIAQPDARDWAAAPRLASITGKTSRTASRDCASPTAARSATRKWSLKLHNWFSALLTNSLSSARKSKRLELGLEDPIAIMQPLWSVALALAVAPMTPEQRALVDPPLLDLAEPGLHMSALEYRHLEQAREAFGCRMNRLHAQYDLLAMPQLPLTAFAAVITFRLGAACKGGGSGRLSLIPSI